VETLYAYSKLLFFSLIKTSEVITTNDLDLAVIRNVCTDKFKDFCLGVRGREGFLQKALVRNIITS
jgi:hypothetical protein